MTCLKCGGLMAREPVRDLFDPCVLWRCIHCGLMLDWLTLRNRRASQEKGADVPNFQSEDHRRKWVESVRRGKAAKRLQAAAAPLPVAGKPGASLPATADWQGHTMAAIERALEQVSRDRAALERAKEILSRA